MSGSDVRDLLRTLRERAQTLSTRFEADGEIVLGKSGALTDIEWMREILTQLESEVRK